MSRVVLLNWPSGYIAKDTDLGALALTDFTFTVLITHEARDVNPLVIFLNTDCES